MGSPGPARRGADVLYTPRLVLHPTRPADAPGLEATYADKAGARFLPRGLLGVPGKEIVARILEANQFGRAFHFTVFSKADGGFVGHVGILQINWENRQAEIGDALLRSQWGKGYGIEAARRVCSWSFRTLHLHRLVSHVAEGNEAPVHILRRLGFHEEGRSRQMAHTVGSGRRWIDILEFGLLDSEFRARRKAK